MKLSKITTIDRIKEYSRESILQRQLNSPATIVIDRNPSPLKRYRFTNKGNTYNPQAKEMNEISFIIKSQYPYEAYTGPVSLDITFYMQLPRSYSKIRKAKLNGKYHCKHIDLDNCIKKLCDCSNNVLFIDDCQVVRINAKKVWAIEGKTVMVMTKEKEINENEEETSKVNNTTRDFQKDSSID